MVRPLDETQALEIARLRPRHVTRSPLLTEHVWRSPILTYRRHGGPRRAKLDRCGSS